MVVALLKLEKKLRLAQIPTSQAISEQVDEELDTQLPQKRGNSLPQEKNPENIFTKKKVISRLPSELPVLLNRLNQKQFLISTPQEQGELDKPINSLDIDANVNTPSVTVNTSQPQMATPKFYKYWN